MRKKGNRYSRNILCQGLQLCLKNWRYLPTAIHTILTFNNSTSVSWSKRELSQKEHEFPFTSKKEKKELIRRANWLCKEVIVEDPEELIAKMPEQIGRQFQGQWAIYACSMTACALCNLIRLYPELQDKYMGNVVRLIDQTNTPTIRYYDTERRMHWIPWTEMQVT